jgi:hypothetical protein
MRIVAVPTGDKSITQNAINGRTGRRLPGLGELLPHHRAGRQEQHPNHEELAHGITPA